jgi:hypothetical protein
MDTKCKRCDEVSNYMKIFAPDLDSLCEKYGIKKYTIKGESVDVDGDVDFSNQKLVKIPLSLVR